MTVTDAGETIPYELTTPTTRPKTVRVGKKRKTSGHAPVTDPVGRAVLDLVDLEKRKSEPKTEPKCLDPDELFLQSCLGLLKELPKKAKYEAKIEIMQLLHRKQFCVEKSPTSSNPCEYASTASLQQTTSSTSFIQPGFTGPSPSTTPMQVQYITNQPQAPMYASASSSSTPSFAAIIGDLN